MLSDFICAIRQGWKAFRDTYTRARWLRARRDLIDPTVPF